MKIGTTRVETFSDGVMSIIITIMVLSFKLPDIGHQTTAREFYAYMEQLMPYFLAYVFSFMMIGIFWMNHHFMFHLLERTDERLVIQNLIFLFWISLIPLATAMIGAGPLLPGAVALYGLIMLFTTLSLTVMRNYTIRKKLVHRDENKADDAKIHRVSLKARTKSFIGTLAYLISVPLAYVHVYLSYICFTIPPILFFIPDGIDDEQLAEKIEEKNS